MLKWGTSMKVAVCLSGCGVFDGAEIHESVLTLYFLEKYGAEPVLCAPNVPQAEVVNHLTGQQVTESRNVLVESARIARGQIIDVNQLDIQNCQALILPGGYGVAKNFTTFAKDQQQMTVIEPIQKLIKGFFEQKKPIGAICISPILLGKLLGVAQPRLTIGQDPEMAKILESWGAQHISCPVTEMIVDETNRIVTTPAYMLGKRILDVAQGIEALVKAVVEMVKSHPA